MCESRLRARLAREGYALEQRRYGVAFGYRLTFNKRSSLQSWVGYADIRPQPDSKVEGTLNEMSAAALDLLDRIELVPDHYRRVSIQVFDPGLGREVEAHSYIAQPGMIDLTVRPTQEYLRFLLNASDVLPQAYLRTLEQVECCE